MRRLWRLRGLWLLLLAELIAFSFSLLLLLTPAAVIGRRILEERSDIHSWPKGGTSLTTANSKEEEEQGESVRVRVCGRACVCTCVCAKEERKGGESVAADEKFERCGNWQSHTNSERVPRPKKVFQDHRGSFLPLACSPITTIQIVISHTPLFSLWAFTTPAQN